MKSIVLKLVSALVLLVTTMSMAFADSPVLVLDLLL